MDVGLGAARRAGLRALAVTVVLALAAPAVAQDRAPLPIMGDQEATEAQILAWFAGTGQTPRLDGMPLEEFVRLYLEEGAAEGVRGDVAFAQSVLETAHFTFPENGQVRAEDRNYGGIGAVDGGRRPNRFATQRQGVRAQVQHLRAYADPSATPERLAHPLVDPRFDLVDPKGRAPHWDDLGRGVWASDPHYARKVLALWAQIASTPVPDAEREVPPGPATGAPEEALPAADETVIGRAAEVVRVAGADRAGTAAALAGVTHPEGAEVVWVTTGADHADALAAAPAAARDGAPLLLAGPEGLPSVTDEALHRLDPERIVVLGGPAAVPDTALEAMGTVAPVTRIAGDDRAGTAATVSETSHPDGARLVYVASGETPADALSAGPAAAREDAPLLLAGRDSLPAATSRAIDELDAERVVVVGGVEAIGDAVVQELNRLAPVTRRAGQERAATAAAVAAALPSPSGGVVYIASGEGFADALAAGPAAARDAAPLLLAGPGGLPPVTASALDALAPRRTVLLGGTAALGPEVEHAAAAPTSP